MTNPILPPWIAISPELTEERLRAIRDVIAKARADKLAQRQPQDIAWNLACDCFVWAWFALHEAAGGPLHDWLHIPGIPGSLTQLLFVGGPTGVPAKFYNANSPGQPARAARATPPELDPLQYALPLDGDVTVGASASEEGILTVVRFAVDVRSDLTAGTMAVQRLDESGTVLYEWTVPLVDLGVLSMSEERAEGVTLPEPTVELPEEAEERERRELAAKALKDASNKRLGA